MAKMVSQTSFMEFSFPSLHRNTPLSMFIWRTTTPDTHLSAKSGPVLKIEENTEETNHQETPFDQLCSFNQLNFT